MFTIYKENKKQAENWLQETENYKRWHIRYEAKNKPELLKMNPHVIQSLKKEEELAVTKNFTLGLARHWTILLPMNRVWPEDWQLCSNSPQSHRGPSSK